MIENECIETVAFDLERCLHMHQRHLLVIGSQCDILNRLAFLPEVAERLHALLRHPGPGGCEGVPLEGCPPGLLRNPTVEAAKKAIKTAIKEAAEAGATLILAYIGHGEFPDEMSGDFYLMPKGATVPTADEAIDFTVHIKDCIKLLRNRGSLIVLLDTCHAGAGAWQAMKTWAQSLRGNIDFELLTATDDRATADAPLTRAVIELLERGDPEAPERIRCQDVHRLLEHRKCPSSQHVAYNPDDARLSLGRNIAHDPGDVFWYWKDSPGPVEILRHTWYFQPTPQLAELVEASRSHPVVVLTGDAGAGKTSLAGALARPEITGGRVPDDFVHAIAILTRDTNQRSLADDLERQLRRSVPGFAGAVAEFERSVPLPQREDLDLLPRKVLRPLAYLVGQPEVRIVLDGFDQLSDFTREAVGGALASRPGHLRLIITARPHTPGCPPGYALDHGTTPRDDLDHYLASRRVPDPARPAILDRASGHWLIASLLAQAVLNDPAIDLAKLPGTVNEAYAKLFDQAGAADAWKQKFRPVLGPLAVAGPGPVLPLRLLARASKELGGSKDVRGVRSVLSALRGLVVRRDAGAPGEHVGLFHTTLADYLLGPSASRAGYALNAEATHRAMVQAIEALAPMGKHDRDDPLHHYAFLREADHLWALGDMERTIACLSSREANIPRENLERWRPWLPRLRERFDEDSPTILALRGKVAFWTGLAGDARGRCGCPPTCCRTWSASWARPPRHARDPQQRRGLDRRGRRRAGRSSSSPRCCRTWNGCWARPPRHAQNPQQHRALDRRDGRRARALRLSSELLPDRERVLGRDHPDTLRTRISIAHWTGATGDALGALRLFTELLRDLERVLGRDHPGTLTTRNNIASWTGEVGDARGRSSSSPRCCRTWNGCWGATTPTRSKPATTSRTGPARRATRAGAPALLRVAAGPGAGAGRDHPDTLTTRNNIASWTGEVGDARGRCGSPPSCCRTGSGCWARPPRHAHHPQQHRVLDRPGGRRARALQLFSALLPDLERVLGRDHPGTLTTRNNIAHWTGATGDARGRCGSSPRCCRTWNGCWGATTPARSKPSIPSDSGPSGAVHRRRDAGGCARGCRVPRPGSAPIIR